MKADNATPELDEEVYLIDPSEWSEPLAIELASRAGIELTDDHWTVIRFMRDYYAEHQVAADARHVIKHLAEHSGSDSRNRLFELFPYGYVAQACKIAGMKRPKSWSTG